MVVVAQLVRAPDCGSGGRRFETDLPPKQGRVVLPFLMGSTQLRLEKIETFFTKNLLLQFTNFQPLFFHLFSIFSRRLSFLRKDCSHNQKLCLIRNTYHKTTPIPQRRYSPSDRYHLFLSLICEKNSFDIISCNLLLF